MFKNCVQILVGPDRQIKRLVVYRAIVVDVHLIPVDFGGELPGEPFSGINPKSCPLDICVVAADDATHLIDNEVIGSIVRNRENLVYPPLRPDSHCTLIPCEHWVLGVRGPLVDKFEVRHMLKLANGRYCLTVDDPIANLLVDFRCIQMRVLDYLGIQILVFAVPFFGIRFDFH